MGLIFLLYLNIKLFFVHLRFLWITITKEYNYIFERLNIFEFNIKSLVLVNLTYYNRYVWVVRFACVYTQRLLRKYFFCITLNKRGENSLKYDEPMKIETCIKKTYV